MFKKRVGMAGMGFLAAALLLASAAGAAEIRTYTGHTGSVNAVAFSPDGTRVLTGSIFDPAKLWVTASGTLIRSFTPDSGVNSVAYSPDGSRVLTGSGGNTARLWDAATGALIRTFSNGTEQVFTVAFSPDGTKVLAGGFGFNTETSTSYGAVNLWDAGTGTLIRSFNGHTLLVLSVAFSSDGTRVLSGSVDKTAKLWNAETGALIRTFTGHTASVASVAFSPDGAKVLTGAGEPDNTARLWNASTGDVVRTLNAESGVLGVAYSPDGTKVLTGCVDKTARLWNAATGAFVRSLTGHNNLVNAVAFSSDGTLALTGSSDTTAKLWAISVPVPNVVGEMQAVAAGILAAGGLATGTVTQQCSNTVAAGLVISQTPQPGNQADPGSPVALVVSTGLCNVTVPNLAGLDEEAAEAAIEAADLTEGSVLEQCSNTVAAGLVLSQQPAAGQQAPFGSAVSFAVSTGLCNVFVPGLVGLTQAAAGEALAAVDLAPGQVTQQCSNTVAAGLVISQDPEPGEETPFGSTVALVVSTGVCNVAVPNLAGLAQAAAGEALAGAGLGVGAVTEQCSNTVAAGLVVSQEPPADQQAPFGSTVALVVSTGVCNVAVPNLAGLAQAAAGAALTGAGLVSGTVSEQCSNSIAAGLVISQVPAADQQVPFGSAVAMTVSSGPCLIPVPDVVGLTQAAAGTALLGADLTPGTATQQCSNTVAAGLVISQQPAAGQQAPFGSVVTLVVSTGACNVAVPNVAGLTQAAAGAALTGASLAAGTVTQQCSNTVAAGLVISQQPAAGQQVQPGSVVAMTVSTGPCASEGEGEPETPTEEDLRGQLTAAFNAIDTNGDGQVSYAEAAAVLPGLPQAVFNLVDTNGDGQISLAEAGLDEGGCKGCNGGKSALGLGNLFLGGLSLMTLLAFKR